MMKLRQFSAEPSTISTISSWYLAGLSKAQGNRMGTRFWRTGMKRKPGVSVTLWQKRGNKAYGTNTWWKNLCGVPFYRAVKGNVDFVRIRRDRVHFMHLCWEWIRELNKDHGLHFNNRCAQHTLHSWQNRLIRTTKSWKRFADSRFILTPEFFEMLRFRIFLDSFLKKSILDCKAMALLYFQSVKVLQS